MPLKEGDITSIEIYAEDKFGIDYKTVEHAIRMWIAEENPPVEDKLKLIHTIRSAEEVFEKPYSMEVVKEKQTVPVDMSVAVDRFIHASTFRDIMRFVKNSPWDYGHFFDLATHLEDREYSSIGCAHEMIAMLFNYIKMIKEIKEKE